MSHYTDPALLVAGARSILAVDTMPLIGIRRMNTDETPSAAGSIDVTVGTIAFFSDNAGATPEGGAGATNFPDETGLAAGVLDLSAFGSAPATWAEILNLINDQPNWEAWLINAVPDEVAADQLIAALEAATTAGITSAGGFEILDDTSVSDVVGVAITENGSTQQGANERFDRGFDHILTGVRVQITSVGTLALEYRIIDDVLQTSEVAVSLLVLTTATEDATLWNIPGLPSVVSALGKRLVVRATTSSGPITAVTMETTFSSRRVSAGIGRYYEVDSG